MLSSDKKKLDTARRVTWTTGIRKLLNTYGFGVVWASQDVGDISQFVLMFRLRLEDCGKQITLGKLSDSARLFFYKQVKYLLEDEHYITHINARRNRRTNSLLRIHQLPLRSNIRNKTESSLENKICEMCSNNCIEDEFHFIFVCTAYTDFRNIYIPKYQHLANIVTFCKILNSNDTHFLMNCIMYVKLAL